MHREALTHSPGLIHIEQPERSCACSRRPPVAVTSSVPPQAGQVGSEQIKKHKRSPRRPHRSAFNYTSPPSIPILSLFFSFLSSLRISERPRRPVGKGRDGIGSENTNSIEPPTFVWFCGNFPAFGSGAIRFASSRVLRRDRSSAPTSGCALRGVVYTYSSSEACSEVSRHLRDGDPILAGPDRQLAPQSSRARTDPAPLTLLHWTDLVSRQSHNRHNVRLDS